MPNQSSRLKKERGRLLWMYEKRKWMTRMSRRSRDAYKNGGLEPSNLFIFIFLNLQSFQSVSVFFISFFFSVFTPGSQRQGREMATAADPDRTRAGSPQTRMCPQARNITAHCPSLLRSPYLCDSCGSQGGCCRSRHQTRCPRVYQACQWSDCAYGLHQ
jgi:hypothetical protein